MRKWNAPELKVLTIEKTENGIFSADFETLLLFKDNNKSSTPDEKTDDTENNLS